MKNVRLLPKSIDLDALNKTIESSKVLNKFSMEFRKAIETSNNYRDWYEKTFLVNMQKGEVIVKTMKEHFINLEGFGVSKTENIRFVLIENGSVTLYITFDNGVSVQYYTEKSKFYISSSGHESDIINDIITNKFPIIRGTIDKLVEDGTMKTLVDWSRNLEDTEIVELDVLGSLSGVISKLYNNRFKATELFLFKPVFEFPDPKDKKAPKDIAYLTRFTFAKTDTKKTVKKTECRVICETVTTDTITGEFIDVQESVSQYMTNYQVIDFLINECYILNTDDILSYFRYRFENQTMKS